ncbi:MAG: TonB family protein [Chlorobiaceae bacterium]|nr:TonB family protein [Chlorobiaceae bacterium]
MISVRYREHKMLQAFGLAFVAEFIILLLLCIGFVGFQRLKDSGMTTPAIIQLSSLPEVKKQLNAPVAQKKLPQPLQKLRSMVKPHTIKHNIVMHELAPEKPMSQSTAFAPMRSEVVSGSPAGTQNGFVEQVAATGGGSGKADPLTEYAAKVKAAVQEAIEYPAAANNMRTKSRARVEFSLRDGLQQNPHIIVSSGLSVFDHAAIRAVEIARYPLPPPLLSGQTKLFQVWVEFHR